jgi:hypothetical protein
MSAAIHIGSAPRSSLRRIDTKRLAVELWDISRGAQLVIGESRGVPACWVEVRREVDAETQGKLAAAVLGQAQRIKVRLS